MNSKTNRTGPTSSRDHSRIHFRFSTPRLGTVGNRICHCTTGSGNVAGKNQRQTIDGLRVAGVDGVQHRLLCIPCDVSHVAPNLAESNVAIPEVLAKDAAPNDSGCASTETKSLRPDRFANLIRGLVQTSKSASLWQIVARILRRFRA